MSKKLDWLGLCLEMMAEYYPIEVRSKPDAEKYWSISEHLVRVMEYAEPKCRHSGDAEFDRRNDLVKEMIRLFEQSSIGSLETADGDTESEEISDNVALNNLLLLSILG